MKANTFSSFLLVILVVRLSYEQLGVITDIMAFTRPVNVFEDPTIVTELAEIKPVSSTSSIDSCDVTSNPNGPFEASKPCIKNNKNNFCVFYNAKADLRYKTANFYNLTVTCKDSLGVPGNSVKLFVYVQPNLAPDITNYRSYSAPAINIKTFSISTGIAYPLTVTDPEKDPLTIQLTSQAPNMGLFALDPKDQTKVIVTKELRCVTEPSYMLTFSVSDGTHVIDDFKVAITLDNLNMFPYINNLPTGVYIPEDAAIGTSLLKLVGDDPDKYPDKTSTTCNAGSPVDNAKFQYNSGDTILTGSTLDYETKDTYTTTCIITDGCKPSDGSDKLTVYLQNVVEGVAFNNTDYNCNLKEGGTRSQSCTLPLSVTDRDNFPIVFTGLEQTADSDKFCYDKNTMRVYLNDPYDVDNNLMPRTAELVVRVVDIAGSSATAKVHVTLDDINDNTCYFDKNLVYKMVDQSTPTTVLDNFVVTDDDLTAPNKDATVNVVTSNPKDCGKYVQVSSQGEVTYASNFPSSRSGTSCIVVINCKNSGNPQRTSLATVIVSYTEIYTTTTSTTSTSTTERPIEKDLWDYGWFVAVFSLLMLCVFASTVAAVAFAVYKCCCQRSTGMTGTPRNQIRPISPNDGSVKRSFSNFDDDNEDDFFGRSLRSANNNQRQWGTPRQIPALEYRKAVFTFQ